MSAELHQHDRQPSNGCVHPACLPVAAYERMNFWCQGWMLVLNHVIMLRNHSYNDKQRARLDVRINQLRARHDAALKRRQPFADALLNPANAPDETPRGASYE